MQRLRCSATPLALLSFYSEIITAKETPAAMHGSVTLLIVTRKDLMMVG